MTGRTRRDLGAYSAPNPKPGSMTLDPIAEPAKFFCEHFSRCNAGKMLFFTKFPASTGLAALRRQTDALHPEKRQNGNGENKFSPLPFFVFIQPVELLLLFPRRYAEITSFVATAPSQTGVQRRISSGAGGRGPRRPLLRNGLYQRLTAARSRLFRRRPWFQDPSRRTALRRYGPCPAAACTYGSGRCRRRW